MKTIESYVALILMPFYLVIDPMFKWIRYLIGCDCVFAAYPNNRSFQVYHYYRNRDLYCEELVLGSEIRKIWRKNGMMHRNDGPAYEVFNEETSKVHREWYLNNTIVTAQDVFEQLTPAQKEVAIWNLDEWK